MSLQKIRVIGTKMSSKNTIEVEKGSTWGQVKKILEDKGLLNKNMKALCSKTRTEFVDDSEQIPIVTSALLTSTKQSNAGV